MPDIPWSFDIEKAKTKGTVLILLEDDSNFVGFSRWLEDKQRWNMIGTEQVPLCWIKIEHPFSNEPEEEDKEE